MSHSPFRTQGRRGASSPRILAIVAALGAIGAMAVGYLLTNITRRQDEARNPFYRVVTLADTTTDPAIWGKNFPIQYDSYRRTVDMVRTRFGGSEAEPRTPTAQDPRDTVSRSRLAEDPRLIAMWAGYAFSKDFREERGHAYMLADQEFTERQQVVKQPGTCVNCHASTYAAMIRLGNGNLVKGFEALNAKPYVETRKEVEHAVSCVDCHDPSTMQLRITRPGFLEGMRAYQASLGRPDWDPNRDATRQEMRSYVCGQCHVEYYFKGPEKRLVFPWANGLAADSILAYYQKDGHRDWAHKQTGAPALKAQHPEFELYMQGVHARSQVACADCHMPYQRVGAMKVSDHHVRSPLLNINRACQSCHRQSEGELSSRVVQIQDRTFRMRNVAMDALLEFMGDLERAVQADSTSAAVKQARDEQRQAQFLLDFVEAENSMGFHAPQEAMRILGLSIEHTRKGQRALRGVRGGRAAGP